VMKERRAELTAKEDVKIGLMLNVGWEPVLVRNLVEGNLYHEASPPKGILQELKLQWERHCVVERIGKDVILHLGKARVTGRILVVNRRHVLLGRIAEETVTPLVFQQWGPLR